MKKVLFLGGSFQQLAIIAKAKELGYYSVLCDYLPDNPGQHIADTFYLASTTDKEKILEIAQKEKIDGIISYASDVAAPTAAYVAEKMNLEGNPYDSVTILCNKNKFREYQESNGFNVPQHQTFTDSETAKTELTLNFPLIIKPTDSSGSKGISVVNNMDEYKDAVDFAFSMSRGKTIVAEEYIVNKRSSVVGGDIFVYDGKVVLWGLMDCIRDREANSLIPSGKSFPSDLSQEDELSVKDEIQNLITSLHMKSGPMNVELIVGQNGKPYIIEIGPRAGGNHIPELMGEIFGIDFLKQIIHTALGMKIDLSNVKATNYYASYHIHSNKDGIFDRLEISDFLEKRITKKFLNLKEGCEIKRMTSSAFIYGYIFAKFNSKEEMKDTIEHINDHVSIKLK